MSVPHRNRRYIDTNSIRREQFAADRAGDFGTQAPRKRHQAKPIAMNRREWRFSSKKNPATKASANRGSAVQINAGTI